MRNSVFYIKATSYGEMSLMAATLNFELSNKQKQQYNQNMTTNEIFRATFVPSSLALSTFLGG